MKISRAQSNSAHRRLRGGALVAGGTLLVLASTGPASAVTQLRRGDTPPAIELPRLDGKAFSLAKQTGAPVVLMFGELYHANTLRACETIQSIQRDARIAEATPTCVLIVTQQAGADELRAEARRRSITLTILHDKKRSVFAAYRVSVLPSVVVLDKDGKVVHALAAMPLGFRNIITDAILFGSGRLTAEQFERTLHPSGDRAASRPAAQAGRLTKLARQLANRGMHDLAAEKYRDALAIDPTHVPAVIGLGRGALKTGRLADAEQQFRRAASIDPRSADAVLGLAYVQALRGGDELAPAEQRVRALLAERPNHAEAHYVLGMIYERTDRLKEAAASFKRSAELLLGHGG